MRLITQSEIGELLHVPSCTVSEALRGVKPVRMIRKRDLGYEYEFEEALTAVSKFYAAKRANMEARALRWDRLAQDCRDLIRQEKKKEASAGGEGT